jgi:hypothetical protein
VEATGALACGAQFGRCKETTMTMELLRSLPASSPSTVRCRCWLAGAAVAVGLVLCSAPDAQAAPEILRPGTRPWEADMGFGPSFIAYNNYNNHCDHYYYSGCSWRGNNRGDFQFKMMEQIGYHFFKDSSGPALGLNLEEGFVYAFRFEANAKFWWDIQLVDDMAIYLYPEAKLGFAFWTNPFEPYFNTQVGLGAKVILDDRWVVFLRPIAPSFFIGRSFIFAWDVMLGGGVTFP